jgi:alpha-glucosidase (family GH31 glycosyl hydrolase)
MIMTLLLTDRAGWADMVLSWAAEGVRVMTYISPFFSSPVNYTSAALQTTQRDLYAEGVSSGYFVMRRTEEGLQPYTLHSLSIEFCMLDLTNPQGKCV